MKTLQQIVFFERLMKITDHPVLQGTGSGVIIGVGRNQNRRNRTPPTDQAPMELDSGHTRHLDVGDQARGLVKARESEKVSRRSKSLNLISQRP